MLTGYAMARLDFRFKGLILGAILAASMFPGVAILTPLFQLFTNAHWLGTYQALIIPQISFSLPLAVYTLTSFFSEMPWELEQAARVDGCTPGQAFRLILLPLAAPALFTTAILVFLASWNEFLLSSNLSNGNTNVQPSTVAIAFFTAGPHIVPNTQTMAAGVDRDHPPGHRGAALPAPDRQRPDRRWRQGVTDRVGTTEEAVPRYPREAASFVVGRPSRGIEYDESGDQADHRRTPTRRGGSRRRSWPASAGRAPRRTR